ncbi:MAG TPA: phosphotransferase [Prolixibacteraceae bacterium]|nr:phosphotransferase [Prolixibacteraceae bacterium]
MNHFPVTNSNLSAQHLGQFLQERYSLSKASTCRIIRAGINDTYLITDGSDKYVFRVYSLNWRTLLDINEEIRLLNQLKENNISVSVPILDMENNYVQTINAPEGERFAVMFTYANGEKLHSYSLETHYQIGELMARMHKVTVNQQLDRVNYTPKILLQDSFKQLSEFLPGDKEEMNFMLSAQKYLLLEFQKADQSEIRNGIVHLDIWFENLNVTDDNRLTIFDFDFCGNGWLCLDIAFYIMQVHNTERYEEKDYQPKVDSFLKGYESIIPISEEEKRLLPMLGVCLYFFYLGVQCQRYDNYSNLFLSGNYLKRYINGLVKRYYDIYKLGDH